MTTLGVIGSGLMAVEVARLAVAAGLEVVLSNSRGPGTLAGLIADLGPLASAATPAQAAAAADVAVAAVPLGVLAALDVAPLAGKPVIDLMNYYPHRDGRIAVLDAGSLTAGQFVQSQLPAARTARVFSNISYHHIPQLARPAGAPDRSALPLAGDDDAAKAVVAGLVSRLGFDTVDAGGLAESWRFEPSTTAYLTPYASAGLRRLEDLRTTPAAPASREVVRRLLERAERTDQAARAF